MSQSLPTTQTIRGRNERHRVKRWSWMSTEDQEMLEALKPAQAREMENLLLQQARGDKREREGLEHLRQSARPSTRKRGFTFGDYEPLSADQAIPCGGAPDDDRQLLEPGVRAFRALMCVTSEDGGLGAPAPSWCDAARTVLSQPEPGELEIVRTLAAQRSTGETISLDRAACEASLPTSTARRRLQSLIDDVVALRVLGWSSESVLDEILAATATG